MWYNGVWVSIAIKNLIGQNSNKEFVSFLSNCNKTDSYNLHKLWNADEVYIFEKTRFSVVQTAFILLER